MFKLANEKSIRGLNRGFLKNLLNIPKLKVNLKIRSNNLHQVGALFKNTLIDIFLHKIENV
jgi:hypothetical protein